MDNNGNDDTRKKRDSTDVVEGDATKTEEKTKKLRASKKKRPPPVLIRDSVAFGQVAPSTRPTLDLEVALQLLVHMGDEDSKSDSNNNSPTKEYLSQTKWVHFRIGQAADASMLAACCRKLKVKPSNGEYSVDSKKNSVSLSQTEDTSLEVRLAEGLGDEDSPPSVFALLADIVCEKEDCRRLGAAALISGGWEESNNVLRVHFFYLIEDDNYSDVADILERRVWLRLSALAIMTSNQLIVAKDVTNNVPGES
jgi:hypothetical protein